MFQIIKRKLTEAEARLVVKEIKSTPYIVGYSFQEWMTAENILVAEDEASNLLGVCLNYDFDKDWYKIAALFVLEEYRGRGIGKALFYKSVRDGLERQKNVYTITANLMVIKMMKDLDFCLFKSLFALPDNYKNHQLYFYLHHLRWIMNLYRIREIIRKKIIYQSSESFVSGILIFRSITSSDWTFPKIYVG